MHFSGRVPDTKFSNHLLKLHVILKHWSGGTNIVNPAFWVSSTVANCYNICGLQVLWAKDAPMQFERCLSPVQFHLNTECSSAAATRIKNQRRSQESSYWSKNNRRKNLREAICCIKQLWECLSLTTQKSVQFVLPKALFFESRGLWWKVMNKIFTSSRHQIDHQLQVVAEWVSLFPRCFHPGHVEQTPFLRPPKLK